MPSVPAVRGEVAHLVVQVGEVEKVEWPTRLELNGRGCSVGDKLSPTNFDHGGVEVVGPEEHGYPSRTHAVRLGRKPHGRRSESIRNGECFSGRMIGCPPESCSRWKLPDKGQLPHHLMKLCQH